MLIASNHWVCSYYYVFHILHDSCWFLRNDKLEHWNSEMQILLPGEQGITACNMFSLELEFAQHFGLRDMDGRNVWNYQEVETWLSSGFDVSLKLAGWTSTSPVDLDEVPCNWQVNKAIWRWWTSCWTPEPRSTPNNMAEHLCNWPVNRAMRRLFNGSSKQVLMPKCLEAMEGSDLGMGSWGLHSWVHQECPTCTIP